MKGAQRSWKINWPGKVTKEKIFINNDQGKKQPKKDIMEKMGTTRLEQMEQSGN